MNDRQIYIATATNRVSTKWRNKKTTWRALVQKCSQTTKTPETLAEYKAMSKSQQSDRKDVGGFVGGYLKEGKRSKDSVDFRDVLCLDIDFGQPDTWDNFVLTFPDVAAFTYSTHKYTPSAPRIRLVILLSRRVSGDEYEAIGRMVASHVGIELFDDTTYQPERLMYWPSTSVDGVFFFREQEGKALDADAILAQYHDWKDVSEWPYSQRVSEIIRKEASKQGNPLQKPGIVGAFCRCYNVHEAIANFLSDIYEPTDKDNRYTYKNGTVAAGLVIYEDGLFAYSHNATDPSSQMLCNAFDLVRTHKFLDRDDNTPSEVSIQNRPSYKAMAEFAASDNNVRVLLTDERRSRAVTDFADITEEKPEDDDKSWMEGLEYNGKGHLACTIANMAAVLENAPEFKGKLWHDDFTGLDRYKGKLPWPTDPSVDSWTNADDSCLRKHMEKTYGLTGKEKLTDALTSVFANHRRHPIREYLASLTWDGEPRLDSFFIDFLGAEDSELVRMQTRKQFTAAVARVMKPGCKFDTALVLVGPEGTYKSTTLQKMAGRWFNDTAIDMSSKDGMEALRHSWIIELGELTAIRRSDTETVKGFLSKTSDKYRPAYGRYVEEHPRQCVFFGTTNEHSFLKGFTGNRRFWIVETGMRPCGMSVKEDLSDTYRDQVWAEACYFYHLNEPLYLDADLERLARAKQDEYNELSDDARRGVIAEFLDTPLPLDWNNRSIDQRIAYFKSSGGIDWTKEDGVEPRKYVSAVEILVECFRQPLDEKARYKTREINHIMKSLDNWQVSKRKIVLPAYGTQQRIYERIINPKTDEEL